MREATGQVGVRLSSQKMSPAGNHSDAASLNSGIGLRNRARDILPQVQPGSASTGAMATPGSRGRAPTSPLSTPTKRDKAHSQSDVMVASFLEN